jgi:hypothetical protein
MQQAREPSPEKTVEAVRNRKDGTISTPGSVETKARPVGVAPGVDGGGDVGGGEETASEAHWQTSVPFREGSSEATGKATEGVRSTGNGRDRAGDRSSKPSNGTEDAVKAIEPRGPS